MSQSDINGDAKPHLPSLRPAKQAYSNVWTGLMYGTVDVLQNRWIAEYAIALD